MKLSDYSINVLNEFITGDYAQVNRSARDLVKYFNKYGIRDVYENCFNYNLSKSNYSLAKLNELNDTEKLHDLILNLFNIPFLEVADSDFIKRMEILNSAINEDGYCIKLNEKGDVVFIDGYIKPDLVIVKPSFEDIESEIINEINSAKLLIWIAVAWFTNRNIAEAIYNKFIEGLNIRILVLNDEINNKGRKPIIFENISDCIRCKTKSSNDNIMHAKFCIIDLKKVINGSFNYTNKAKFNNEVITTITSKEHVEAFAMEFNKLWREYR
ncbi:phospholipase D-like domain-containing protein [Sphingobacterium endophyticum]|uniref:phospholipase D-like domain-containing protein n=1 Tax=Sphingobacterium endophyticum TaxID=2546448 RepID=UPI0012E15950|nr:phospholipase D-like domain-containing protein [Sphingobacterium endophyticum]